MYDCKEQCVRRAPAFRLAGPLLLLWLGACAGKAPPAKVVKAPPAPPQKLAWMPLDPLDAPSVAKAVNQRLSQVKIAGATTGVKSAVSMEVAQLALECISPTTTCYRAVGHSLGADRLMWAEIDPDADDRIKVTVFLFDVRSGAASRRVGTYDGVKSAQAGVAELVSHAGDGGSRAP